MDPAMVMIRMMAVWKYSVQASVTGRETHHPYSTACGVRCGLEDGYEGKEERRA